MTPPANAAAVAKRDWRAASLRTVVCLGESTTAGGWSTSPERCWVGQLERLLNDFQRDRVSVVNSGIGANLISADSPAYELSGKPAADLRLEKHVIGHRPDLVVVAYGLNDARGATPLTFFVDALRKLVRRVHASASPAPLVLLLGPYHMTTAGFQGHGEAWSHADLETFRAFNRAIEGVADAEGCLFTDALAANGETDWMVHFDGVHANDLGHRMVAHAVFQTLAQNCSCLAATTQEAERHSLRWRDESVLMADFGFGQGNSVVGAAAAAAAPAAAAAAAAAAEQSTSTALWPETYAEGRSAFLHECAVQSIPVQSFDHPLLGPGGSALATDVATVGDPDAKAVLMVCTATHGVEGFTGSACLVDWLRMLRSGEESIWPAAGVRIVLVHAINPHGYAWIRRVNEVRSTTLCGWHCCCAVPPRTTYLWCCCLNLLRML